MKIKFVLLLVTLLSATASFSQKPVLTDDESIHQLVTAEIDGLFASEDFLKQKNKKFKYISGTMVVDIGVVYNGKVSSFFKVESNINDIDFINFMSDYILQHRFKFRLPKDQRSKIRYEVHFNS